MFYTYITKQRDNIIHQCPLWGNIIRTCPGLSRGDALYTYIVGPSYGNVYKIHGRYIHAHTGAISCYKRKLTLLGIIISKGVTDKLVGIIIIVVASKRVGRRTGST